MSRELSAWEKNTARAIDETRESLCLEFKRNIQALDRVREMVAPEDDKRDTKWGWLFDMLDATDFAIIDAPPDEQIKLYANRVRCILAQSPRTCDYRWAVGVRGDLVEINRGARWPTFYDHLYGDSAEVRA